MNALDAAVAVAREHGLRVHEPRILKDSHNLVVHLAPSRVVARVAQRMEELRPRVRQRELDVTLWLAERGLPVLPPASELPPGPHHRGGFSMTFWPFVERQSPPDGRAAGRALREIDEALPEYGGTLDSFWPPREARAMLERLDLPPVVGEALTRVERELAYDPVPLHGDAHFRNCYFTERGALWGDLEDACHAPPEWDAACLAAVVRILGANGEYERALAELEIVEEDRLDLLVLMRAVTMVTWSTTMYGPHPGLEQRLAWLEANRE